MGFLSFGEEFESEVAAARFFRAHMDNIYATLVLDYVLSSSTIAGDGGPGTIYQYNFPPTNRFSYVQELHYEVDREKFVDKLRWIEGGDIGTKLKSYDAHIKYEPTISGGCVCKYVVQYVTMDGVDYIDEMKEERDSVMAVGFKLMEDYLLANPEAYA